MTLALCGVVGADAGAAFVASSRSEESAAPLQDALVHGRADVAQHMLTFRETAEGVCAPQSTWNPRLLTAAAECSSDP